MMVIRRKGGEWYSRQWALLAKDQDLWSEVVRNLVWLLIGVGKTREIGTGKQVRLDSEKIPVSVYGR
jgi:hypothetical protein